MAVRRLLAASLWPPSYEARLPAARIAELAELVLAELEGRELRFKDVQALLEPHAREGVPPTFLWRRVQGHSYVVHVPPSGIWGYGGLGVYTAASGRVRGEPPAAGGGVRPARPRLPRRVRARDEAGRRPVGGRAAAEADRRVAGAADAANVRDRGAAGSCTTCRERRCPTRRRPRRLASCPRFDNLVLSHADRSRILGDIRPSRIVTKNGLVHATILVDGFVAGTWQLEQGRVVLEPFARLDAAVRRALKDEASRLEAFVA